MLFFRMLGIYIYIYIFLYGFEVHDFYKFIIYAMFVIITTKSVLIVKNRIKII